MKKSLLILLSASCFFLTTGHSQCIVSNIAVELKLSTPVAGGCEIIFNLSWEQETNSGNKHAYVHLWRSEQYPDLNGTGNAYLNTSDYPISEDLIDAIATIPIEENGSATPFIGTMYHPDPVVPVLNTGMEIEKEFVGGGRERVTISHIVLTVTNCSGSGIRGDIWACQSENGKNMHCVSSGMSFVVGNPRVDGFLSCQLPRQYNIQIQNIGDVPSETSYNVYIDEGDSMYEPTSHDLKITTVPVGPLFIDPGTNYLSGLTSYLPYSNQKPYSDQGLWIEVFEAGTTYKTVYFLANSCIPLPYLLLTFTANRVESAVRLDWTTAHESECLGFEVHRKISAEDFVSVAFIPSLAQGGNSWSLLQYHFTDNNPIRSITEYRVKQIDINGRVSYSEIRYVRGFEQQPGFFIYPNPAINGQVTFLLDDLNRQKDIAVFAMDGKLIRKWRAFTGSSLRVNGLRPGLYMIKVITVGSKNGIIKKFEIIN